MVKSKVEEGYIRASTRATSVSVLYPRTTLLFLPLLFNCHTGLGVQNVWRGVRDRYFGVARQRRAGEYLCGTQAEHVQDFVTSACTRLRHKCMIIEYEGAHNSQGHPVKPNS